MTELRWTWGYPAFWAYQLTIGLIAVTLLLSPLVVSWSRSFVMAAPLPHADAEA